MTEYDHWPPIRFRFAGDVEQAKGRIPQARTLMSQLIRRMEGQERDAGQWQGQLSDGTQFRVAKMGDVHVADIFGVAPAQMPDTVFGPDYGQRDDGMPLTEGVVIPEIPEAPHVNPRDILMRPHGERFSTGGDYLWIGCRVEPFTLDYSQDEDQYATYPHGKQLSGTNAYTTFPNATYGPGQVFSIADVETIPLRPVPNLILFEPGFEEGKGSVLQTYDVFAAYGTYDPDTKNEKYLQDIDMPYDRHETIYQAYTQYISYSASGPWVYMTVDPLYGISKWVNLNPDGDTGPYDNRKIFRNNLLATENGTYTTYPYIAKKDGDEAVHAYICVDPDDKPKKRGDLDEPPKAVQAMSTEANFPLPSDVQVPADLFNSSAPSAPVITEITPDPGYPVSDLPEIGFSYTYSNPLQYESEATVEFDNEFSVEGTLMEGVYELRLAVGWPEFADYKSFDAPEFDCSVIIQLGQKKRRYSVTVQSPYTELMAIDQTTWIDDGEPINTNGYLYPGCWLIDIKKGTVIHETNPANLDRPWFTQ